MAHKSLIVEQMTFGDLREVVEIEHETISPWSLAQLEAELHQSAGWQFVARCPARERIVGYACGKGAADEAEIYKIVVAFAERRQGVGSVLLQYVLQHLAKKGYKRCYLEMRASNAAARHLYEKNGFVAIAAREKYYNNPQEDAVVMVKKDL